MSYSPLCTRRIGSSDFPFNLSNCLFWCLETGAKGKDKRVRKKLDLQYGWDGSAMTNYNLFMVLQIQFINNFAIPILGIGGCCPLPNWKNKLDPLKYEAYAQFRVF